MRVAFVPGPDAARAEMLRQGLQIAPILPCRGACAFLFERAADPLHRGRIDPKLSRDPAHTRPPRLGQRRTDAALELGGYRRPPQAYLIGDWFVDSTLWAPGQKKQRAPVGGDR